MMGYGGRGAAQQNADWNSSISPTKILNKPSIPTTIDDLLETVVNRYFTTTEKTKLSGIAFAATANNTDAALKNRANHTGLQAIFTVSGLQAALDGKQALIAAASHVNPGATDAATNAPTGIGALITLLTLVGEVNATNTRYNILATKYNDLATKFNTLLSHLESQGLQASS